MWSRPSTLRLCQDIQRCGLSPSFSAGERVGRGYADLGVEEFLLLPSGKMLALFSGSKSDFPSGHEQHFFRVWQEAELLDELSRRGVTIDSVQYVGQRRWKVVARNQRGELRAEQELFLDALLTVLLESIRGE